MTIKLKLLRATS